MSPTSPTPRRTTSALLLLAALAAGCQSRKEVVVFHATSLSRAFGELAERFEKDEPRFRLRLEPSGSQVAARKVSELGLRADLVAVADAALVDELLAAQTAWSLSFATNSVVLAHLDHSQGTAEVSSESWPQVLRRPGVRLGRANPDLAPLGYDTLLAWQLCEQVESLHEREGLAAALTAKVRPEHVAPDEAELLALLQSRAIDYAFVFRSTAEDHRLKVTELPKEADLSRPELAARYATARVEVRLKREGPPSSKRGAPIVYALAAVKGAPNPEGAARFLALLVSDEGRRTLTRMGFLPLDPPKAGRGAR